MERARMKLRFSFLDLYICISNPFFAIWTVDLGNPFQLVCVTTYVFPNSTESFLSLRVTSCST